MWRRRSIVDFDGVLGKWQRVQRVAANVDIGFAIVGGGKLGRSLVYERFDRAMTQFVYNFLQLAMSHPH